jgi:hypothetical protein
VCKELADALLSRRGQLPRELGLQCGVGALFRWRGDNVLQFRGASLVQLRNNVKEFEPLAVDTGEKKIALQFLQLAVLCEPPHLTQTKGRLQYVLVCPYCWHLKHCTNPAFFLGGSIATVLFCSISILYSLSLSLYIYI